MTQGRNNTNIPSPRNFGFTFSLILSLIAIYFVYINKLIYLYLFAPAIILLLFFSIFSPNALNSFNYGWYKIGIFIGKIVSPIVLGIIFFIFITPVAMVTRLLGRDELRLKKNNHSTYWIKREPKGPEPDSFKRQY